MTLPDRPLSPVEFAKALGCGRHTVDCAIRDNTIPAARIGRRYFIPRRVAIEILENGRIPQAHSTPAPTPFLASDTPPQQPVAHPAGVGAS
ncbi:helix-turn-helix domain-containing protein [Mesorhizobium koreense]|uniref:helix-turn-helix domain-containing protein n=1 Tax=Mesorhizobium koreense TaxID=3074855 RepID=UPI00287BA838|nr:helix-turn-helix domain-containing protein [Mesorhizobium sp. WR6]